MKVNVRKHGRRMAEHARTDAPTVLRYGTATGSNEVDGIAMSSTISLPSGKVAYLQAGGDRLILGGPRGHVGRASKSADQTGIGAVTTDVTDLSVTFGAVAGRLYMATLCIRGRQNTSTGTMQFWINDGTGSNRSGNRLAAGDSATVTLIRRFEASGSVTVKAQANTNADTMDVLAASGYTATLTVEDIGLA